MEQCKDKITECFDDEQEGMKGVIDAVAGFATVVTEEFSEAPCSWYPSAPLEQLLKCKYFERALEKLTEGEAQRVVSTVADDNCFEAWMRLNLLFEPELEAQKNPILLELHNIPAGNTIDEAKVRIVELKVRIARAENILGRKCRQ